ncbi:MAG TPA: hypothetical protein VFP23_00345 [Solirubrobacterales bacterium]|nr:hypothetical protein [Solirubrobacterales bacterium]
MATARWRYPRGLIAPPARLQPNGAPLQLFERGLWDPAEEYWGEAEDAVPVPLVEVASAGPRQSFEFEQLLPGGEAADPEDPIGAALALRDRGEAERAAALLAGLLEWDRRCLDVHAHLGLFAFERDQIDAALGHYAAGVAVAELSLPEEFGGVIGWSWIDNRPFLRCLQGLTLSAWRSGEFEAAEALCRALLWLNPGDHLGASELLPQLIAGERWQAAR